MRGCRSQNRNLERPFINVAHHDEKAKRQNVLTEEHITKIVDTYRERMEEVELYACRHCLEMARF